MAFDRTRANIKDLVEGLNFRPIAGAAWKAAANLVQGRVELSDKSVNRALNRRIKGSEWLIGAEVECRDDHIWFELSIKVPVKVALGLPLKINSLVLEADRKLIVFERISEIDIQLEAPLQRGLAHLGRTLVEDVIGLDPVAFTLNRLDFVKAKGKIYEVDLSGLPGIDDRLMMPLLGQPLVEWITIKSLSIQPGGFVIQLMPVPLLIERLKSFRAGVEQDKGGRD